MAVLEINLEKIKKNTENVKNALEDIELAAVTKGCRGDRRIAKTMVEGGAQVLADSHLKNLEQFKDLPVKKILLRHLKNQTSSENVFDYVLISNIFSIKELGKLSFKNYKEIGLMLMVETGFGRDGFNQEELPNAIKLIKGYKNLYLYGLATNTDCQNGSSPLARIYAFIKIVKNISLPKDCIISGGNTSALPLAIKGKLPKEVNQLRIGEAILLGQDTKNYEKIVDNFTDCFTLKVEVIEKRKKKGVRQAVLAIGFQDIGAGKIEPIEDSFNSILCIYSDHLVYRINDENETGSFASFRPDYYALNALMTSPFVEKKYSTSIQ